LISIIFLLANSCSFLTAFLSRIRITSFSIPQFTTLSDPNRTSCGYVFWLKIQSSRFDRACGCKIPPRTHPPASTNDFMPVVTDGHHKAAL
jgi:hypothetical protein